MMWCLMMNEKVMEIFPQFERVIKIEKELLKKGDIGYELFYKLNDNTIFSIATIPKNGKILIIHAIGYKRNLDHRFKRFRQ